MLLYKQLYKNTYSHLKGLEKIGKNDSRSSVKMSEFLVNF